MGGFGVQLPLDKNFILMKLYKADFFELVSLVVVELLGLLWDGSGFYSPVDLRDIYDENDVLIH